VTDVNVLTATSRNIAASG